MIHSLIWHCRLSSASGLSSREDSEGKMDLRSMSAVRKGIPAGKTPSIESHRFRIIIIFDSDRILLRSEPGPVSRGWHHCLMFGGASHSVAEDSTSPYHGITISSILSGPSITILASLIRELFVEALLPKYYEYSETKSRNQVAAQG